MVSFTEALTFRLDVQLPVGNCPIWTGEKLMPPSIVMDTVVVVPLSFPCMPIITSGSPLKTRIPSEQVVGVAVMVPLAEVELFSVKLPETAIEPPSGHSKVNETVQLVSELLHVV